MSAKHIAAIPKTRISARVREALRLMVEDGLKRSDAALKAGLKDNSLYIAMRKPEVCSYRASLMEALRTSEAARTISRAAMLADNAESEHVRLQANTWLGGLDGIAPIQRTESLHIHQGATPGLTIIYNSTPAPAAPMIDVTPRLALPIPKPHPSMINRASGCTKDEA